MTRTRHTLIALALAPVLQGGAQADVSPSPVIEAMQQELSRSMTILGEQPRPPYFLSYEITEGHAARVTASFGALTGSDEWHTRLLDIDLRVGDYAFDNTHPVRDDSFSSYRRYSHIEMPIEDDEAALRSRLWYYTDRHYKEALEQFTKVSTNVKLKVEEEDRSPDLSHEPPERYLEPLRELRIDRRSWERKVEAYTKPFATHGDIYQAVASLTAKAEDRFFVNSEGARIQTGATSYRLILTAFTKAPDGMELPRHESFFAHSLDELPDDETVLEAVRRMIADLEALRSAPVVDPYTGPAILSGRASGVFFHEIFGHRVEGHRQRNQEDAQTFKDMVGQPVLPEGFSVVFDPTLEKLGGVPLSGHYRYDNQGVKARRVAVVTDGKLERFLMSRRPIEGFGSSNGHGRKQAGFAPVSRQSNLVVEVDAPVSDEVLRKMLIERVRRRGLPFGLYFEDIEGGFTFTGRTIPNAFNVRPVMVYRIYPDGRQELVRGVDLIGTPLTVFSKIVAGDDQLGVFNGTCGAESGGVPVSAVSPNLLVDQIEVQRKEKSQERPPLLPAPGMGE